MGKDINIQIHVPDTVFNLNTDYGANSQSFDTLNELVDVLRTAGTDWKRAEGRGKAGFKFSETFFEVVKFIEEGLVVGINEETIKSRENLFNFFNQKSVDKQGNLWSFVWDSYSSYYSSYQPTFSINAPLLSDSDADNYKAGYKILKNTSVQTYEEFFALIKNGNQIINNINSNNKQKIEASLAFLSIKVQNKAILGLNTNLDEKGADLIVKMSQVSSSIDSARVSFKKETQNYLELQKQQFEKADVEHGIYIEELKDNLSVFIQEKKEQVSNLEDSYEQKLKLKAPIKFWEDESKKYKKSAIYWSVGAVVSGLLIILTGLWILKIGEQDLDKLKNISIIPVYFVPIALISLLIYILRTLIKIAISNQHISVEYAQKAAMTDYYLSMIQEGHIGISIEEKQLLLPTIFSKIDSGLIKSDSAGDSDISELLKILVAKK